mgnify:CR=1 FL=1
MTPEEKEVLCLLLNEPNIHRDAAFHFARQANTIYDALLAKKPSEQIDALLTDDYRQMQIYSFGAVIAAFSFLDAQINDFFGRCRDDSPDGAPLLLGEMLLTQEDIEAANSASCVERFQFRSTKAKYDTALRATKRKPFDVTSDAYQALATLNLLRNFLAHGEGQREIDAKKIADVLIEAGITPLLHAGFPDSFLIGPTATWAVNAVTDFFVLFCKHLYDGSPAQLRGIGD